MSYMPLDLLPLRTTSPCDHPSAGALDIDAARHLILANVVPVNEVEHVPVGEAIGRIAAGDVLSPTALPRFDNSAMDGYAAHAADLTASGSLPIADRVQAGQGDLPTLTPGTVVRVTTGAAVPAGTAAVIPDEDVKLLSGSRMIRVRCPARSGANIRRRGEDTWLGDILIRGGTRIDARHVAIVRAAGVSVVGVRRRSKVALLSVGNELVAPDDEVGPGKIVDVNRILLRELLATTGAEIVDLGIAEDSAEAVAERLNALAGIDVLITTGGVAGSECDVTAKGVEVNGGDVLNLHLTLKPGRSIAFGRLGQLHSLHLPGNPIAALVSAHLFAVPLLALLAGRPLRDGRYFVAAGELLKHRQGRTEFVLAKITEGPNNRQIAVCAGKSSSSNLRPLCEADGFLEIPAAAGDVSPGQPVRFHPFGCEFG